MTSTHDKIALFLLVAIGTGLACAGTDATPPPVAPPAMETEDQKTFYALGLALSASVAPFNLTESELELVKAGMTDGALRRTAKVDLAVYRPKLNEIARSRAAAGAAAEKAKGQEFLAKAAAEPGAVKSASGLVYSEIKAGAGESPKTTDTVRVHYTGTLIDGFVFDSSVKRNEPIERPVTGFIPCWTEALQKMKPGGKAKIACPAEIAYQDRGSGPDIKPGATLVFEMELLEIKP